jgi:hypothetical protein
VLADRLDDAVDVPAGVLGGQALGELDDLVDDDRRGGRLVGQLVRPEAQHVAVDDRHAPDAPPPRVALDQLVELHAVVGHPAHQGAGEPVELGGSAPPGRTRFGVRAGRRRIEVRAEVGRLVGVELVEQHPRPRVVDDAVEDVTGWLAADVGLEEDLQGTLARAPRIARVDPPLRRTRSITGISHQARDM